MHNLALYIAILWCVIVYLVTIDKRSTSIGFIIPYYSCFWLIITLNSYRMQHTHLLVQRTGRDKLILIFVLLGLKINYFDLRLNGRIMASIYNISNTL